MWRRSVFAVVRLRTEFTWCEKIFCIRPKREKCTTVNLGKSKGAIKIRLNPGINEKKMIAALGNTKMP